MNCKLYLLTAGIILSVFSCRTDVEEELYPCEFIGDVSYSEEIVPILSQNCYQCHSAKAAPGFTDIVLEGHSDLMVKVNDGVLLCAINHRSCAKEMPLNGDKLDQCLIDKIEVWINEGAKDN